jgi:hypothetical protein
MSAAPGSIENAKDRSRFAFGVVHLAGHDAKAYKYRFLHTHLRETTFRNSEEGQLHRLPATIHSLPKIIF